MKHLILALSLGFAGTASATDDCHLQSAPQMCPTGHQWFILAATGPTQNPDPDPEMCGGICLASGWIEALQCSEGAGGHWCTLLYLHPAAQYQYSVSNSLGTHQLLATGSSVFVPCGSEAQSLVARWTVNGHSFASAQTLNACEASF